MISTYNIFSFLTSMISTFTSKQSKNQQKAFQETKRGRRLPRCSRFINSISVRKSKYFQAQAHTITCTCPCSRSSTAWPRLPKEERPSTDQRQDSVFRPARIRKTPRWHLRQSWGRYQSQIPTPTWLRPTRRRRVREGFGGWASAVINWFCFVFFCFFLSRH